MSWITLAATIVPSVVYFCGWIDLHDMQWLMFLATVGWFVATPLWMGRERTPRA
jgi:hypothetical protein